jgi:hypothetical protein
LASNKETGSSFGLTAILKKRELSITIKNMASSKAMIP